MIISSKDKTSYLSDKLNINSLFPQDDKVNQELLHEMAAAYNKYAGGNIISIDNSRRNLSLILGKTASGKTLLSKHILGKTDDRIVPAGLIDPNYLPVSEHISEEFLSYARVILAHEYSSGIILNMPSVTHISQILQNALIFYNRPLLNILLPSEVVCSLDNAGFEALSQEVLINKNIIVHKGGFSEAFSTSLGMNQNQNRDTNSYTHRYNLDQLVNDFVKRIDAECKFNIQYNMTSCNILYYPDTYTNPVLVHTLTLNGNNYSERAIFDFVRDNSDLDLHDARGPLLQADIIFSKKENASIDDLHRLFRNIPNIQSLNSLVDMCILRLLSFRHYTSNTNGDFYNGETRLAINSIDITEIENSLPIGHNFASIFETNHLDSLKQLDILLFQLLMDNYNKPTINTNQVHIFIDSLKFVLDSDESILNDYSSIAYMYHNPSIGSRSDFIRFTLNKSEAIKQAKAAAKAKGFIPSQERFISNLQQLARIRQVDIVAIVNPSQTDGEAINNIYESFYSRTRFIAITAKLRTVSGVEVLVIFNSSEVQQMNSSIRMALFNEQVQIDNNLVDTMNKGHEIQNYIFKPSDNKSYIIKNK